MAELFEHNASTSHAEVIEHEQALSAKRITQIPNQLQIRAVNDADGNPTYIGYAPRGLSESSAGWELYNISYVNEALVCKKIAYDSWSNYLTATYT